MQVPSFALSSLSLSLSLPNPDHAHGALVCFLSSCLLSFPLTSALCPGGAGRRVEWRGKTRSKVQEWAGGGGGDHGWAVAAAEAHDREGGTWVSEGCVH